MKLLTTMVNRKETPEKTRAPTTAVPP
jgi:hypothetical protein